MKTIRIDEELCDGCGECITSCVEGALEIVNGKARLVRAEHCDGLGACIAECPRGAITLVDRKQEEGATSFPRMGLPHGPHRPGHLQLQSQCPGSRLAHRTASTIAGLAGDHAAEEAAAETGGGELTQWPVQLHLVAPNAPYFRGSDLLLAADCVAFARADFHPRFLRGRALAIACPKLDDTEGYVEKLTSMMLDGGVRSVTVVTMEVPCCRGLERLATIARTAAGTGVPLRRIVVGIDGRILVDQPIE